MGGLDCVKFSKVQKLLRAYGFRLIRQRGSHMIYHREGLPRPIPIALHGKEVEFYNLKQIWEALNMSKERFEQELRNC
jgi:predicted RNA binding protein YcfA (HicA-like mRNA interferase family)